MILLSPYLNASNADQLIAAAAHAPKSELGQLIVKWFPKQDVEAKLAPVAGPPPMLGDQLPAGSVGNAIDVEDSPEGAGAALDDELSAPAVDDPLCSQAVETPMPRPKLSPLSEDRFVLQLTMNRCTHDKLRYAQELMSHQLPSGDLVEVFDRALDALIVQLEKRKFAATFRPRRAAQCSTKSPRHIPAHVKRELWVRDGGQCTFVSKSGHRCCARELLEFDHVEEVALGGKATVSGMRLRCRTHNQFEAERTFGAEFMKGKREEAQRIARESKATKAQQAEVARVSTEARVVAEQRAKELDVVPWLRAFGFPLDEARRAAAHLEFLPDASIEDRVRQALAFLAPRATKQDFRRAERHEGASV